MKFKIIYPLIPNNVAGNLLRIRVKEYHQTRRGLKKNKNFDWYKKFEQRKEPDIIEGETHKSSQQPF